MLQPGTQFSKAQYHDWYLSDYPKRPALAQIFKSEIPFKEPYRGFAVSPAKSNKAAISWLGRSGAI